MQTLSRIFLTLIFAFTLPIISGLDRPALAAKLFSHDAVAKDGERYESFLKKNWRPGNRSSASLRRAGDQLLAAGSDPRAASRFFAMAVVGDESDSAAWIGLARALLAITPDRNKGSERYNLPVNASGAAYIAYQRAKTPAQKAVALAVLSDALKRRSYWRVAIDALKESLTLADNDATRAAYEALRAEHGFRVLDYKVDSDAVQPRLCVQFSEQLAQGQIDFAKFISVGGKDPQSINAETRQICIDGLSHGKRYDVQIRAGLPAAIGEKLLKSSNLTVYVRDRSATVRFTGRNYVLPNKGQQGIPLVSVNTGKVAVEVFRIGDRALAATLQNENFGQQISRYQVERIRETTGARVYKGEMDVASRLNEDVTTAFPVSDAVPQLKPGVYALIARPLNVKGDSGNAEATQWFIVSDLGLTALKGDDGVHAFVRSLDSADPVAGINVRLVARNNEVLGSGTSDASGYVRFAGGLARGAGGLAPAILVAEAKGGDYAFLDLASAGFDLTDRGVKGREAPGPLDGYLYTDRGVYRPGENVHLTGLVRDRAANAAALPVTLIVSRPDGVGHRRMTLTDQGLGGRSTSLALGASVMTGTWRAKLFADPKADPIAQVSFLVEDFVPERLELKLAAATPALRPASQDTINISGRYLYGPPAADLALEGDIIVRASTKSVAGFEGYHFGQADEFVSPVRAAIDSLPRTDAKGDAAVAVTLPPLPKTARPLEAQVLIRMREPGGRSIERSIVVPVAIAQPRIGIKPLFKDGQIGEGEVAQFKVLSLDADGKARAIKDLKWELMRLDRNWQWYRQDGSWRYDAVTMTRRVATGTLDSAAAVPAGIVARVDSGRYRLDVVSTAPGGPATSYLFNAGWWSGEGADSPEMLDVALDKESYRPGETAKLKIAAKQAGKAMIAVLNNGLVTMKQVAVPKGGAEVPLTVDANWTPGVYVTAMLYRPMDRKAKRMPGRSIGLRWLAMDTAERTLQVALDLPEKVKSGGKLRIPVKLTGLAAGEDAYFTVAAVDRGILNLTHFKSPAPQNWFHAQRRMGVEIRDFYGRLIDGMRAETGKLRSGGDGAGGLSMQGAPPSGKPLALFSGLVRVGADGAAAIEFDLPDFNGSVRVMAVAWSASRLGASSKDVIIRDPVALLASGPRFLTMGDETRIEVDLHNVEGPAASYKLSVDKEGTGGLKQSVANREIKLAVGERRFERFAVTAAQVGTLAFKIRVTGPNGIDVNRSMDLAVLPPAGDVKRTTVSKLEPGGSLHLTNDLFTDLIASRSRLTVNVGPAASLDVPGILTALDRYPYGCAEQTVSRALPLLYANAMAVKAGIANDAAIKERIEKAVARVFEMQSSSGAFGIWGPSSGDIWLTSYVTDFLTRAGEVGYSVPQRPYRQALDRLQNFVSYVQDFKNGGEDLAYALYVLARNGRAPVGELRYYADTRIDRFATPLAKAQLGAALAMMGDKERAETAFAAAMAVLSKSDASLARVDYGSTLRDGAALLTLVSETGVSKGKTASLVEVIAKAYAGKTYTSTQEQAWMLLAARSLSETAKSTALSIDGKPHQGEFLRGMSPGDLDAKGMTITNNSSEPVDAVITVNGAALTPEPAVSKGFTIERSYFTLAGKPVDLKSATGGRASLKQNDRLVVLLKVEAGDGGGRVLLVDRLPAGLEIENPRLVASGDLKALPWLKDNVQPEHTQFRDDRFVAAFDFFSRNNAAAKKSAMVAYIVRAVSPGSFVHPAATIEDMYRPERFARTASGRLDVTVQK